VSGNTQKKWTIWNIHELRPDVWKQAALVVIAVLGMGFFLSFLIDVNLGTDPCTFMNVNLAKVIGTSLGNWQLFLNVILFILVIVFTGWKLIGIGTIANMVLIGYVADFCRFLWSKCIPDSFFIDPIPRAIIFFIALLGFTVSASVYMNGEMGVSPYDGLAFIIGNKLREHVPYFIVRIAYAGLAVVIGFLAGGKPNIGTIALTFALGPMVSFVGKKMRKRK
jgi:uncharacterized membrane protein YczE